MDMMKGRGEALVLSNTDPEPDGSYKFFQAKGISCFDQKIKLFSYANQVLFGMQEWDILDICFYFFDQRDILV